MLTVNSITQPQSHRQFHTNGVLRDSEFCLKIASGIIHLRYYSSTVMLRPSLVATHFEKFPAAAASHEYEQLIESFV